ncbi:hypothetical protein [Tenacibaculum halocynthiae]|uniref:hypothetical protein n=1 Tax=Tenacibaculum halocynthiae TaxID=1254437 RepID=UPI0038948842
MKKTIAIITLIMCVSCGVLPQKNNFHTTKTPVELGVIGEKQKSLRKTAFQTFGVPKYDQKIKVSYSIHQFKKDTYKEYKKAISGKDQTQKIIFNDSIPNKPFYTSISVTDKVSIVSSINENNLSIFNYLKKSPEATIITGIKLTSGAPFLNQLKQSDAIYLQTDKYKKQRLLLFKNEKKIGELDLSKEVIFGYQLSSFCWKTTKRRKIKIATIVNEGQNCSNTTKRNAQELENKLTENSFKF